jgi:signal transduction histidine kinase
MPELDSAEIKKLITNELGEEDPDLSKMQKLINELSKQDDETVAFSVDAALIDRLGRELVQKKETAVSELVKNAYDADATEVNLIFENTNSPGGTLKIIDNGHGMSRDRFINAFMRISSLDKINNPQSPKYNRQKAGRKGIGRFSAQRLGSKLVLVTKTQNMEMAIKVEINWEEYKGEKELVGIRHDIEEVSIDDEHGTMLTIGNLREKWTEAQIQRVYRYISDLIQPYPLSKERKDDKNKQDPGFKANFYKLDNGEPKQIIDEESFVFDFALAKITAEVDSEGNATWSIRSKRFDLSEEGNKIGEVKNAPNSKFKYLKNVDLEAYYFIYKNEYIPPQQKTRIQELANENGGIRLYRNGFRVLPYAEPNDDWLRLDYSVRRTQILAPHGNNNFFGFIEIRDPESETFEETSSREGLIENDAFGELTDFAHRVLISGVLKISELRGTKGTTGQKDWEKKKPEEKLQDANNQINEIINDLDHLISSETLDPKNEQRNKRIISLLNETTDTIESASIDFQEQLGEMEMLRVLSSLGLIIGEFTHEIRQFLGALQLKSTHIEQYISNIPEAKELLEEFKSQFKSLRDYTSYFDSSVSHSVNRELEPIDLNVVVNRFEDVVQFDLERSNIKMDEIVRKGTDLYSTPMHQSEWASILFNLYSNSKKAIDRARVSGRIRLEIGSSNGEVYLKFSDNGDGIPQENEEKIFNAFFTTSSPSGPDEGTYDDVVGSGLGLKIIKDIISSYNGEIKLVEPPEGFSTTFYISVPKNNTEKE